MISHQEELIPSYLDSIDGLMITGGRVDIDPTFYGQTYHHPTLTLNPERTRFEMALLTQALKRSLPVLGICGGHQLINVVFGGSLIQHIPDEAPSSITHREESIPLHTSAHRVDILPSTHLSHILNTSSLDVNSAHHQAIKTLGEGLKVSAQAPDGLIEAFESIHHPFVMGIQWHPEFLLTSESLKIFKAFIHAASQKGLSS